MWCGRQTASNSMSQAACSAISLRHSASSIKRSLHLCLDATEYSSGAITVEAPASTACLYCSLHMVPVLRPSARLCCKRIKLYDKISLLVQGGYKAPTSANPTAPPMPSAPGVPDYTASRAGILSRQTYIVLPSRCSRCPCLSSLHAQQLRPMAAWDGVVTK